MAAQPMFHRGLAGAALLLAALAPACATGHQHRSAVQPTDSVQVGYGQQSRRDVTSAVSSVQADPKRDASAFQLEQLIQGRVAGVEILRVDAGRVSLRIRGASSFLSSSEPLYVIDGVKVRAATFSDAMAGINPADVARIDVLKDAGATAIYGTEGANGVVLVTTKRAH